VKRDRPRPEQVAVQVWAAEVIRRYLRRGAAGVTSADPVTQFFQSALSGLWLWVR
jgi:hypothetical protein